MSQPVLPPLSQEAKIILNEVAQQIEGGTVKLMAKDEKVLIEYTKNKKFEPSNHCGKIVAPKTKTDTEEIIKSCLYVMNIIKANRAPDGVLLDPTKISCKGTYEENTHYEKLDKILGKGLNGQIVVVRDKKLDSPHALKTVMLAYFNTDEIRCWTDLEGHDNFPALYMFNRENGKVKFHHEILENAVTISDIIENHMQDIREEHELLRHFSLYVLQGLLEASTIMHSKNWLHDDLHANNAMIQAKPNAELKIRVLDFGRAKHLDEKQTVTKDIQEIIRVFTSVYVSESFLNAMDLKDNCEKNLEEQSEKLHLSQNDRDELLSLVKLALDVNLTKEEIKLKEIVDVKLKNSLEEAPDIMNKIYKLIFPKYPLEYDSVDGDSKDAFEFQDILKIGSKKNISYNRNYTKLFQLRIISVIFSIQFLLIDPSA